MSYQRVVVSKFGGPRVLKLIEEPELPEPRFEEVRVKAETAGVAFTDVMIRKGKYPDVKVKPPFTPGYDLVGVIDKVGKRVTRFEVGQRIAAMTVIGAHSEYVCLPENSLIAVPDELDPFKAVSLILSYVTAYQMLHRAARVKKGQRILIHGAGGAVGTAMIQLGRLQDLHIFGTASKSKHEIVANLGATPIDYKKDDFVERIKSLTEKGVDAVFDHLGGDNLKRSFQVLRPKGILVSYGFYNSIIGKGGNIPLDLLKLQLWNIIPNGRLTKFFSIGALRQKHPDWFSEDLARLFDFLSRGMIKPVISRRMKMAQIKQAHELVEAAQVQGKLVLEIGR